MYRNSRDGMPNCKMFTYQATSLPTFFWVFEWYNAFQLLYICTYIQAALLCDVASRILIADIIYRNSVFSSLHFIGCTTTLELWAASNTGLLLTVHLYEVPGSPVFTLALMICSTKYRYTTTDGTKRLVQIQAGVSNQQLTVLHKWMLALQIQYK